MKIEFAQSFFKSFKRMINRQKWYWKIWDFFRYDLSRGIKNLIFFFPVVWKFRTWDSNFQLRVFKRSLEPLRDCLTTGQEIDITRDKKVAAISRAIEILDHITEDTYIQMAEHRLGYEVDTTHFISKEPEDVKYRNAKLFILAREIEEKEWDELWKIFEGQKHSQFEMFKDKAKSEGVSPADAWYKWFNGSDIRGWWN
jgi:hypothetical protein